MKKVEIAPPDEANIPAPDVEQEAKAAEETSVSPPTTIHEETSSVPQPPALPPQTGKGKKALAWQL